jgi:hypothetical protein
VRVEGVAVPKPEPKVRTPKQKPAKKGIKKANPARKAKRFLSDFGGAEYHAYITSLPCDICGVEGFTVAAHLKSRGAGGKAADCAPLCAPHPTGVHGEIGIGCHAIYDEHRDWLPAGTEARLRELAKARRTAFQYAIEHAA